MTLSLISPTTARELPAAPGARPRAGLALEVERRLCRSGYLALRDVSCDFHAGIVRLRGRLPTYYLKQVAQAIVSEIAGVHQVINHIEIIAPAGRSPLGREGEESMVATGSIPFERSFQSWEGSSPTMYPERSWERCWS